MYRFSILLITAVLCSLCASAKVVLSENFDKFTAGTESVPAGEVTDFDSHTLVPGWSGTGILQAAGAAFIPVGSQLVTPPLDLGVNGGNYCISFKARSAAEGAFFFLMDSNGGYSSGDISDQWTSYTVALSSGTGPSSNTGHTLIYFYAYTDILIDDIVVDDSGVAAPAALPASDFTTESFTASWQSVPNAKSYVLNVFTLDYDVTTTVFSRKYLIKSLEVEGTSYSVVRDDFTTPYYYTVSAKSGDAVSGESNIITVAPAAVEPVEALEPSDITDRSFTARWTSSSLASQYYLHILKHHTAAADETYSIIDTDFSDLETAGTVDAPQKELDYLFDGDWFAHMPLLAKDMVGINNQDIDFFGQAYLQSPLIDLTSCGGSVSVSFTAFGRKGLGNASVKLCNHSPALSFDDIRQFAVTESPAQYSFTLTGGSKASSILITSEEEGMMYIDNLKVTVNLPAGASLILPVRTAVTTATSLEVSRSGIPADDRVAYYVRASWAVSHKDGEVRQIPEVISDASDYVWVPAADTAVSDISCDGAASVTARQGVIEISNPAGRRVSIVDLAGRSIVAPDASCLIHVNTGIYIVRVGDKSFKIAVN